MAVAVQEYSPQLSLVERGERREKQSQPPLPENPSIKLMNTRVWMRQLSEKYGEPITLGTIPDPEVDALAKDHNIVWCMGIYEESKASKAHAKKWAFQFSSAIAGFDPEIDVVGSPYAIPSDEVNPQVAHGWNDVDTFRFRLHKRGVRMGVDFVPNHVARDHPWTKTHPQFFWGGNESDITTYGTQFYKIPLENGDTRVIAHGKDPNFGEWEDTAQLNYTNPELQQAQIDRLLFLSQHADLIRCDVAMLVNKDTIRRTWGWRMWEGDHENLNQMEEFWERAIRTVKQAAQREGRTVDFMAEAYWDQEMLGEHFDYIYDKTTYDRMKEIVHGEKRTADLLPHLSYLYRKEAPYKPVLFTENHDEPREGETFGDKGAKVATIIAALTPGMYLHHHGQENDGVFKTPMTTDRIPHSETNGAKAAFYDRLFTIRNSRLAKEGETWLHYVKNSDGSDAEMIGQQFHHKDRGVIVVSNLNGYDVSGNIFLPPGAQVRVVDMITGEEIKDQTFTPSHDGSSVRLSAFGSRALFYDYPYGLPTNETF